MNHLLYSLTDSIRERITPREVDLGRGRVLLDVGAPIVQLHFPLTAVVSAVIPLADGRQPEAGVVGCEGVVGGEALLGRPRANARWVVQVPGRAAVVDLEPLAQALSGDADGMRQVGAFTQALLAQAMRTVVCNTVHAAEQRFARWLLMCADRVPNDQVSITHDFISQMLGMARPRVSMMARKLQDDGLIDYGRGVIRVADRAGLQKRSCECYASVRSVYGALLGTSSSAAETNGAHTEPANS